MGVLSDTASLMASADYKERFKAEYLQLAIRTESLEAMLEAWDRGELDFTPKCEKQMLKDQLFVMKAYGDILVKRALIEGVDLF